MRLPLPNANADRHATGTFGARVLLNRGARSTPFIKVHAPFPVAWTLSVSLESTRDNSDPDPAITGELSWGIEAATHQIQFDWQPGARAVLLADNVQLAASYSSSRNPTAAALEMACSASLLPGAFAPQSNLGLTILTTVLAGGTNNLQVPPGAAGVTLIAPTAAAWGTIGIGQRTGLTAALQFENKPLVPTEYPILQGCRWVAVHNLGAGALTIPVRYSLVT